jgi:hypothetical protein
MPPGRRDRIDLEGCESRRAKDLVEMGRTQGIEDVPQAVIIECSTREPRLQQRHHASLCPPLAHRVEGMMPIHKSEHQGFDPTPA